MRSIRLLKILDIPTHIRLVRAIYTMVYDQKRWDDDYHELETMTIWYASSRDMVNAYDVLLESLRIVDVLSTLSEIWLYVIQEKLSLVYMDELLGSILLKLDQ